MKRKLIFICIFVLLILSCFVVILFSQAGTNKNIARIYQDGNLVEEIDLSKVKQNKEISLAGNIIAVESGRICMKEANCPDKLCVRQGWISNSVVPIVCLPNKVVIELSNKAADADIISN